jgi:hypothetical protein
MVSWCWSTLSRAAAGIAGTSVIAAAKTTASEPRPTFLRNELFT